MAFLPCFLLIVRYLQNQEVFSYRTLFAIWIPYFRLWLFRFPQHQIPNYDNLSNINRRHSLVLFWFFHFQKLIFNKLSSKLILRFFTHDNIVFQAFISLDWIFRSNCLIIYFHIIVAIYPSVWCHQIFLKSQRFFFPFSITFIINWLGNHSVTWRFCTI